MLIESVRHRVRNRCYLDHDPDDLTTELFFRTNGKSFSGEARTFLDDIYGIPLLKQAVTIS